MYDTVKSRDYLLRRLLQIFMSSLHSNIMSCDWPTKPIWLYITGVTSAKTKQSIHSLPEAKYIFWKGL